jgi:hypothetical protein
MDHQNKLVVLSTQDLDRLVAKLSTNLEQQKLKITPFSEDDKLSEKEAAKFLGISRGKLAQLRSRDEVPYSRISFRKVVYSKIKLMEFLESKVNDKKRGPKNKLGYARK